MAENIASALCYVLGLLTGILFLVLAPYNQNRNIRFHAFQSIFLHVAFLLIYFACSIVFGYRLYFVMQLVGLAGFAMFIYMIVSAYQGRKIVLPVIGPLAQQQAR